MTSELHQFLVVRRPRHEASGSHACRVWVEASSAATASSTQEARLVNLSRYGARLSLDDPLASDERIVIHIENATERLRIALPGRIRWQHTEDDGGWSVGCQFDEPVAYEAMGELFLNGILDAGTL